MGPLHGKVVVASTKHKLESELSLKQIRLVHPPNIKKVLISHFWCLSHSWSMKLLHACMNYMIVIKLLTLITCTIL